MAWYTKRERRIPHIGFVAWGIAVYKRWGKRVLGLLLALVASAVFLPFHLIIALLIKIDSRGPIFFKQQRIGIHRSRFLIYKYRTMDVDAPRDVPTHLMSESNRYITRVGRVLRKTSLDEVPQLMNIILGQMAIVGPRPALWNQYDLIAERDQYGANDVLPGLTGWAQVNGRDELSIPEKARLDGEYVRKISFLFDLKCLLRTVSSVAAHQGVLEGGSPAGHEDMR